MDTIDPKAPLTPPLHASAGSASAAGGIDVRTVLETLWRRRAFIGKCVLASVLIAVVLIVLVPRKYTATALLTVDPRGLRVVENEVTPRGGQTPDVNTAVVETQSRVLVSDSVLLRVVEREKLDQNADFTGDRPSLLDPVKSMLRFLFGRSRSSDPEIRALTTLRESVRAWATKNSYVISLTVTTRDADLSAQLGRALIEAFQAVQLENHKEAARRSSESLASRLQELKNRVGRAEAEVQRFKAMTNIVGANGQLVHEQQLTELSNQLTAARLRTTDLRTRYELTQRLLKAGADLDASADALKSPVIAQLRARYAEARQQEDDFAANLGARHPLLQSLRTQTGSLRQQIAAELARIADVTRTDYEQAVASERDIDNRMVTRVAEAASLNQHIVQLRELEREAQASRAVYEAFLNRAREMREQQEIDTTNMVVISPAIPPQRPNGLPPILMVLVGGVLGFNAGGLAAVLRDRNGARIRPDANANDSNTNDSNADDSATAVASPASAFKTLAARFGKPVAVPASELRVLAVLPQPPANALAVPEQGGAASSFIADFPPEATAVGASRALYQLYDTIRNEGPRQQPRVVLVTSFDDDVGKACVALGLALAATTRGEKALLVDGNPGATLSYAVGRPGPLPFEDVLTLHVPMTAAVQTFAPAGLAMLTNKATDKPRAALSGNAVQELLVRPASQYDLVVIDGGLAGANASLPAIAAAATHALLVTRDDSFKRDVNTRLRDAVGPDADKFIGAVVMTG